MQPLNQGALKCIPPIFKLWLLATIALAAASAFADNGAEPSIYRDEVFGLHRSPASKSAVDSETGNYEGVNVLIRIRATMGGEVLSQDGRKVLTRSTSVVFGRLKSMLPALRAMSPRRFRTSIQSSRRYR